MSYVNLTQKTNFFHLALFAAVVGLSGCADQTWWNGFTGEPVRGVISERSDLERVDALAPEWPNLATVPPRPQPLSTPESRMADLMRLESAQADAAAILAARAAAIASAAPGGAMMTLPTLP